MRARVLAIALSSLVGGCIDGEFLRGTECSDDRDCGRSLSCQHGVCGGCPAQVPLVDGRCPCPGERVLDCRYLDVAPHCMPVCRSADELCKVAEVIDDASMQEIPSCVDDPAGRCFELAFDDPECRPGEAKIFLQTEDPPARLVVNCPPPESDESRFDCEPQ